MLSPKAMCNLSIEEYVSHTLRLVFLSWDLLSGPYYALLASVKIRGAYELPLLVSGQQRVIEARSGMIDQKRISVPRYRVAACLRRGMLNRQGGGSI
jgi:hypothetical protein